MDWMNFKRIRTPFLVLIFGLLTTSLLAQTPNFDRLKNQFDDGQVFRAIFSQTFTDSYTGEVTESQGEIWLDKIRYKLEADGQVVVVDGETSKVYDPSRNRVIIDFYDSEEDDFAPSRMLGGIDSTYSVSEEQAGQRTKITLTTDDDFAVFSRVEILIDRQSRPVKITAWDISDNEIETNFTNGTFLDPAKDLFQISYPEDAEVVDMRY
ncbi:MAG: hypothetical protein CL670_02380 [Balneola sp.]|jgi:outer membrane lipoprotein-sorting protein|nr:hypothetical protein [Balneola sp.]MBE77982.1 hypothetical protein [Balneola sp.]|tara:strand:- start:2757 stop:3383 length:627 start_codon:yes stop_codon:yes gene_type:complete